MSDSPPWPLHLDSTSFSHDANLIHDLQEISGLIGLLPPCSVPPPVLISQLVAVLAADRRAVMASSGDIKVPLKRLKEIRVLRQFRHNIICCGGSSPHLRFPSVKQAYMQAG